MRPQVHPIVEAGADAVQQLDKSGSFINPEAPWNTQAFLAETRQGWVLVQWSAVETFREPRH